MAHAKTFTASGFERLMLCPGSAVLCADAPRRASQYSAEGTAIHEASARVLQGEDWPLPGYKVHADGFDFAWDADMQDCGQAYVDYVQGLAGDFLMVEQRVAFGPALGIDEPDDGFGTADAIVGKGDELIVIDLKCGRGVEVTAGADVHTVEVELDGNGERCEVQRHEVGPNPQLALYAIGALAELQGLAGDFTSVRLVIVQPRAGGVSEYVLTVDELTQWAQSVARPAARRVAEAASCGADVVGTSYLNPTEKGCKFCAAKATCPALRDEVAGTMGVSAASPDEFGDIDENKPPKDWAGKAGEPQWLAACLSKVDLIEDWCKAVRAEAERRLCEGQSVPGYKLVAGKKGSRQWADDTQAEDVLRKQMRLPIEKAYNLKLISPPQAEKLFKAGDIGPRQWPKLQQLITQGEGKPHVAPESDPRPAITVAATADDFDLA